MLPLYCLSFMSCTTKELYFLLLQGRLFTIWLRKTMKGYDSSIDSSERSGATSWYFCFHLRFDFFVFSRDADTLSNDRDKASYFCFHSSCIILISLDVIEDLLPVRNRLRDGKKERGDYLILPARFGSRLWVENHQSYLLGKEREYCDCSAKKDKRGRYDIFCVILHSNALNNCKKNCKKDEIIEGKCHDVCLVVHFESHISRQGSEKKVIILLHFTSILRTRKNHKWSIANNKLLVKPSQFWIQ